MLCSTVGSGAAGVGVVAAVFGMLGGILAALWFLLSELWDVGIMRMILVITLAFASLMALISGIIYCAWIAPFNFTGTVVAACIWQWFIFLLCGASAFFVLKAGGGGTASA